MQESLTQQMLSNGPVLATMDPQAKLNTSPVTMIFGYDRDRQVFFVRKTDPPLPSINVSASATDIARLRAEGVRVIIV